MHMSLPLPAAAAAPATTSLAGAGSNAARRLAGAAIAAAAAAILGLAAWLEPSPTGLGTHTQAGLPGCPWVTFMDLPCPTCGMTTAFAHAADGDLVSSFLAQPFGAVLAIAAAAALFVGSWVAISGSDVIALLARQAGPRLGVAVVAGLLAAWVFKILSYKGVLG